MSANLSDALWQMLPPPRLQKYQEKRGVEKGFYHDFSSLRKHLRLCFTRIPLPWEAEEQLGVVQTWAILLMKGNFIRLWLREPALALTWFRQVLEGVGFRAVRFA